MSLTGLHVLSPSQVLLVSSATTGHWLTRRTGMRRIVRHERTAQCWGLSPIVCVWWLLVASVLTTGWLPVVGAEELRDPFTFGARVNNAEQAAPILMGIVWDPQAPLAVIGNTMVNVGDVVNGWQVVEIQRNGILIRHDDDREFIAIGTPIPPTS